MKFDREKMMNPWAHQDGGVICERMKQMRRGNDIQLLLQSNYFCYHIGVPDRGYFLHKKTRWINPKNNHVMMQVGDIKNDQNDYFDKYYTRSSALTFKDNYPQRYFIGQEK